MKQCELWNVLQNEDEHRLLWRAFTHIWAQNNFAALFSTTERVADWAAQRPVFGAACALRWRCDDVIRKEAKN